MKRRDDGNAVVEFIGVVIAVMVPLALVAGSCWALVVNQLALRSAVHGASRAYVLSADTTTATARVKTVMGATAAAYGFPASSLATSVHCSVAGCLVPGGFVTVSAARTVSVSVPLVGRHTVTMRASDTAVVDLSR